MFVKITAPRMIAAKDTSVWNDDTASSHKREGVGSVGASRLFRVTLSLVT